MKLTEVLKDLLTLQEPLEHSKDRKAVKSAMGGKQIKKDDMPNVSKFHIGNQDADVEDIEKHGADNIPHYTRYKK